MSTLREAAQQALEAMEKIADWHGAYGPFPENNEAWRGMAVVTARESVTALSAALAQQEQPKPVELTIERLRDALVASRIIPPASVEDPDGYDGGVTLFRIEALHRRIT
jgi:hypothetical protein